MRRNLLIVILITTVMMLSACGTENEAETDDLIKTDNGMPVEEEVSPSDTEETAKPEENAPTGGYREIYEWIVEKEEGDSLLFSLRYLDEDDIPELMIDTGFEAGGCFILTYHNGVLSRADTGGTDRTEYNLMKTKIILKYITGTGKTRM